jgi:hypothetical protein
MRDSGMPMQATPSPCCRVVALHELAEYSVVQGAGKGCTIGQDRLVGFKDHRFNQKYETIENLPNRRHHRVMYYPNSPRKQVLLCQVSNHANYHRCQRKIQLYQKALHMALLNGRHRQLITNKKK